MDGTLYLQAYSCGMVLGGGEVQCMQLSTLPFNKEAAELRDAAPLQLYTNWKFNTLTLYRWTSE